MLEKASRSSLVDSVIEQIEEAIKRLEDILYEVRDHLEKGLSCGEDFAMRDGRFHLALVSISENPF